jgi:hypothetical protein
MRFAIAVSMAKRTGIKGSLWTNHRLLPITSCRTLPFLAELSKNLDVIPGLAAGENPGSITAEFER